MPTKKAFFGDYVLEVWANVYEPAEDSFLFAENLQVTKGARVLDVGTGCGLLGIVSAEAAGKVISVDVNPYAVRCARQNALRNRVADKMAFLRSDLFTALRETAKFDLILFNAPYLPTEDGEGDSWLDRAWAGGATGRQVIDRFISQVPSHLQDSGRVLLMQSTLADVEATKQKFVEAHLNVQVVAEQALPFFETLVLLEAKRFA